MKRAIAALLAALLVPAAAVAAETEIPAPWDESQTITITMKDGRSDLVIMTQEDYCRAMAWLLQLYQAEEPPSDERIRRCGELVADYMDGQAWIPKVWVPIFDAGATAAAPQAGPKQASGKYTTLAKRGWQLLVKSPDKYEGRRYHVWACISQFDAATGEDSFRGQASFKRQRFWFTDADNAMFTGNAGRLANFVQDDIVEMSVTSLGSLSYDTQIGGNTTVPLFQVDVIKRAKGSC